MTQVGHEAEEVKDVVWTYAGWAIILLICVGAGVFIGYTMWGDAAALKRDLNQSVEMVGTLKNERETLKSQVAKWKSDKEDCEKRLTKASAGSTQ